MSLTVVKYRQTADGEMVIEPTNSSNPVIISPPLPSAASRTPLLNQSRKTPLEFQQYSITHKIKSKKQSQLDAIQGKKSSNSPLLIFPSSPTTSVNKKSLLKVNTNANRCISNVNSNSLRNYSIPENAPGFVFDKIPAIIKPILVTNATQEVGVDVTKCLPPLPKTKHHTSMNSMESQGRNRQHGGIPRSWPTSTNIARTGKKVMSEDTICMLPPNTTIRPANGILGMDGSTRTDVRVAVAVKAEEEEGIDDVDDDCSMVDIIEETMDNNNKEATMYLQTSSNVKQPTIVMTRDPSKERTIRSITLEMIERKPQMHIGVHEKYLPLLKHIICTIADVSLLDLYITLKKLKQNEEFALIGEYFEMNEQQIQDIFMQTLVRCARYFKYLLAWPNHRNRYERHRNLPIVYRKNLNRIQNMVECVETDMREPLHINCTNYKFILTIDTNNIITYISEAFIGHHDDLIIFKHSDFQSKIPKHLSLFADPGKAIQRRSKPNCTAMVKKQAHIANNVEMQMVASEPMDHQSMDHQSMECDEPLQNVSGDNSIILKRYMTTRINGELIGQRDLNVVNDELVSKRLHNFSLPTIKVQESIGRQQIRQVLANLRDFKVLQRQAALEPIVYQYLNEVLIVVAALVNLQR